MSRAYGRTTVKPSTATDPLLRQIFAEQDRLNITTTTLAKLAGFSPWIIHKLRHPTMDSGKNPSIYQVRRLAEALDFKFPNKLQKNGDH